jgi:TRAP-type C4-dicarboxylate transport system permease small subunit
MEDFRQQQSSAVPAPEEPATGLLGLARAVDRVIAVGCEWVLLITGTVLTLVLMANVVARYVLASGGFDWAEEVPEQIFPWFIMAGVALAVQSGGHIAVEWLLGRIGHGTARIVLVAGHVLVAVTYLFLAWKSVEVARIVALELSPALGLPKSYGYGAVAIGCALLAISTVTATLRIVLLGPEARPQPAPESMPT